MAVEAEFGAVEVYWKEREREFLGIFWFGAVAEM
jgi:hypothetical protein